MFVSQCQSGGSYICDILILIIVFIEQTFSVVCKSDSCPIIPIRLEPISDIQLHNMCMMIYEVQMIPSPLLSQLPECQLTAVDFSASFPHTDLYILQQACIDGFIAQDTPICTFTDLINTSLLTRKYK